MDKYLGLKIGISGFCIAAVSVGCVFAFDSKAFVVGAFAGWGVGVCGLVVHFLIMFKLRLWRR
jgi:ABC-type uncharacterized transport system permease subunit